MKYCGFVLGIGQVWRIYFQFLILFISWRWGNDNGRAGLSERKGIIENLVKAGVSVIWNPGNREQSRDGAR